MKKALSDGGFEPAIASSGEEALTGQYQLRETTEAIRRCLQWLSIEYGPDILPSGGATMRLIIPDVKNYSTAIAGEPIKDGSGQTVGHLVYSEREGRSVSLFGGKYAGRFDSQDGVVGFVRGVEAVLNHMTSTAR